MILRYDAAPYFIWFATCRHYFHFEAFSMPMPLSTLIAAALMPYYCRCFLLRHSHMLIAAATMITVISFIAAFAGFRHS